MRRGTTIFIYSLKGGVGKSTITVNIAGALSLKGKRVLVIDLDPQCAATYMLGLKPESMAKSICGPMMEPITTASIIKSTRFPGIDIIPSTRDLWALDIDLEQVQKDRDLLLRNILAPIRELYDLIIIDSHNKYGWTEVNALRAADGVLIPIQCGFLPFHSVEDLHQLLSRFKKAYNSPVWVVGYVLTMYRGPTFLHWHVISKDVEKLARKRFGELVFKTVLTYDENIARASEYHEPVEYYRMKSIGSIEFVTLTEELMMRLQLAKKGLQTEQISNFHCKKEEEAMA